MEDFRLILVLASFALGGAFITWLISILLKKRFWKFIPSLLALGMVLNSIVALIINKGEGMMDLANFAMIMIFGCALIGSLITAVIIDKKKNTK